MAEEANPPVSPDTTNTVDEPTRPTNAVAEPAIAEAKPAEGGVVATSGVVEVAQDDGAQKDDVVKEDATADAQPEPTAASDDADAAPASDAPATNGTPVPKKAANGKRKSGAGVPEHKKKTLAKKGKKELKLRLNVLPGDMFMVAMRGYQPWPVIVCDEEMLPESLLSKRPVSARRIDGTYRADFMDDGKNAKDRRYPIMFLGTNEFAWQVNTDLLPFDLEEVKKDVESGNQGKKNKQLWEAYQVAAEGHDLAHFKEMLTAHESAMQEDLEQKDQKKQAKSAKRKSTAPDDSEDVEMGDDDEAAPSAKKAKATKKRKKGDESDGENEKATKTPKTKLKLTTKTPKDASAAKPKKEPKSKKKPSEEAADPVPEEPPMTEEERLLKREKQVLYLRHRLQKGFLSRDQAPKDEDMTSMSEYLTQLEAHEDLEAEVIKKTKVHKVLRAIMKLETIPMEGELNFKKRSADLLNKWSGALASESEPAATNGVKSEDREKSESAKEDAHSVEKATEGLKINDTTAEAAVTKTAEEDGDVPMSEADKDVIKDAPAAQAEAEKAAEPEAAAATTETAPA